jgi:hypothetical protein
MLRLAEYIESEPARKKAEAEAKKAKLEALEKKLGISKDAESSHKKRRLDDDEYIEQSKEIVENVKSAVSMGIVSFCYSSSGYLTNFMLCSFTQKEEES